MHAAFATIFAFFTAFLTLIWMLSGGSSLNLCSTPLCGYMPNHANITFLSMGFLTGFLFGLECLNLVTSKREWNTGYESKRQKWIRRIGFGAIWLGACETAYGLFELNATIMGCNSYSCGSVPTSYYVTFYFGICLVTTGAVLMFVAKFVQPRLKLPETRPVPQSM